jgi:hypothetical protein
MHAHTEANALIGGNFLIQFRDKRLNFQLFGDQKARVGRVPCKRRKGSSPNQPHRRTDAVEPVVTPLRSAPNAYSP